jgi:hypothetical protein
MQEPIVTVLNHASSYDLVDLATVKDELNITNTSSDTKLQRWITSNSKRFANVCGRVFPEENVSEVFRQNYAGWCAPGAGGSGLVLTRRPVTNVSSVTEDTSVLTTDDYEVDYSAGMLYRLAGGARSYWRGRSITVVYSAGFYPIPEDVQQAILTLMAHKWASQGRDPLLRSFSIENVGAEAYWVPLAAGSAADLPPDLQPVADTIAYYRQMVIA